MTRWCQKCGKKETDRTMAFLERKGEAYCGPCSRRLGIRPKPWSHTHGQHRIEVVDHDRCEVILSVTGSYDWARRTMARLRSASDSGRFSIYRFHLNDDDPAEVVVADRFKGKTWTEGTGGKSEEQRLYPAIPFECAYRTTFEARLHDIAEAAGIEPGELAYLAGDPCIANGVGPAGPKEWGDGIHYYRDGKYGGLEQTEARHLLYS